MLFSPTPMHIPDGFLALWVNLLCWLLALGGIALALRQVRRTTEEQRLPLMGVLAAAIFAGQMLNFPITGGTSGHLLGAALATLLLGPWQAVLVMTSVVSIQALIFQDGGVLALGANLLNMALIGVIVAYAVDRSLDAVVKRTNLAQNKALMVRAFVTGWASIFVSALACALELALSGSAPATIVIPAMAGVHALIGIGEGLLTLGAVAFVLQARPEILTAPALSLNSQKAIWLGGLGIAAALTLLSPLASTHPDGLEWVAEKLGFLHSAQEPLYTIIPDYAMPGITNEVLATILAGLIGLVLVVAATLIISMKRHRRTLTG